MSVNYGELSSHEDFVMMNETDAPFCLPPYELSTPPPSPRPSSPVQVHQLPLPLLPIPIDPKNEILHAILVQRWPEFPQRTLAQILSSMADQVDTNVLQQRIVSKSDSVNEIEEDEAEHFARIQDSPHFDGNMES